MKYGQYADTIRQEPIEDCKWEALQSASSNIALYESSTCRVGCDLFENSLQLVEKIVSQPRLSLLRPLMRLSQFIANGR